MSKKYIVTITRQFGSMGRPIARAMSEQLGIEYYDRDIVDEISKNLNLPVSTISNLEERYSSPNFFNMVFPLGFSTAQKQEQIFGAAWTYLIVAEIVGASSGIGYSIQNGSLRR